MKPKLPKEAFVDNGSEVAAHDEREGKDGFLENFSNFAQDTTLHGMKFVLRSPCWNIRRILWTGIVIGLVVGFIIAIKSQIETVQNRPTLTKVNVEYVKELEFPGVTICEINTRPSTVFDSGDFDWDVLDSFLTRNITFFESMAETRYSSISITRLLKAGYRAQSKIIDICYFGSRFNCLPDVQEAIIAQGKCFTINGYSGEIPNRTSHRNNDKEFVSVIAGPLGGLTLYIDLCSGGNISGNPAQVLLHDPKEKVKGMMTEYFIVAPGTDNYIEVKAKQHRYLPAPFKAFGKEECVENDYRHPLVSEGKYTHRACNDACLMDTLEKFCGCSVVFDDEATECDPITAIRCLNEIYAAIINTSTSLKMVVDCGCPVTCHDVTYETSRSAVPIKNKETCTQQNITIVRIYFDRLKVESFEQVPDYSNGDIFASVGGQMGLFLGASVITLVEIAEFIIRSLWRLLQKRFKNSVDSRR